MKKSIEFFKEKRTYFKVISMILVLALMVQTVSVAVTAITESGLSIEDIVTIDDSSETTPSIVGEVESSRDRYTKVYELADGSFYEVISNEPIHKNIDGQWEEPANNLDTPESIDEVTSHCDELVDSISEGQNSGGVSTFSYNASENDPKLLDNTYVAHRSTGLLKETRKVSSSDRLIIKIPDSLLSNSNTNQITIKQTLFVEFNEPTVNTKTKTGVFYAYGITENWQIDDGYLKAVRDGAYTAVGADKLKNQGNILDSFTIGELPIEGYFDITEICNKWNKKVLDNNGILIKTTDTTTKATIGNCYVTKRYLVVDAYDTDFTYHTIDMGKAGQVFINDFTNTLTIQRNEMYYPTGKMPINLYRYFDFSKSYTLPNYAGYGSHWNYECPLINETELVTAWSTFDGRTIRFTRTQTTQVEWHDDQGEGYVLNTDGVDILNDNYYNATITSPDGLTYTFGAEGKIRRIDDSKGNYTTVKYNETNQEASVAPQDYITSIENNSGYRYNFVYGYDYDLDESTELNKFSLTQIQYQKETDVNEYETISIDGIDIIMTYKYVLLPDGNLALSEVIYPHSESKEPSKIEYNYDENGHLTDIFDIDKRKLNMKYIGEIPDYVNLSTNPAAKKTVDNYPSVFSLTEEVVNKEYSPEVEGSEEYFEKSSLEIERHHSYQRKFVDHLGNTETIHFNQQIKLLYYNNDNGDSYYVDYSTINGEHYISQIVSPESANDLTANGDFEDADDSDPDNIVIYDWGDDGNSSMSGVAGSLDGNGSYYIKIDGTISEERYGTQFVRINGSAEDVFVVGGHARTNSAVPTDAHFFGIEIYKAIDEGVDETPTATDELLYRLAFDPTMDNETQYRLGAFKLTEDTTVIEFRFVYSYQNNDAEFDNALIYNASEQNVSFLDAPSTENTDNEDSSDESSDSQDSNNSSTQVDVLSDGTNKMISTYEYDSSNNYLVKHTDNNNVVTNYVYDNNTGLLTGKSISVNSNLSSLTDNHSYNAIGALKEVTRIVDSVGNTTGTSYTYEYGKISSVVHNNMTYNFNYNSYGDLKDIVMVPETNDELSDIALISYEYTTDKYRNINKITYSNGKVLGYEYDSSGRVVSISDCSNSSSSPIPLYTYTYDESGDISKVTDYTSYRVMNYSNNLFEVHELVIDNGVESNGELLYSKQIDDNGTEVFDFFSVEYSKTANEPTYDNESKTTTYSSIISMGNDYPTTFESRAVCDYFGRIKSSSVNYTTEDNSETCSIVNESSYKEYSTQLDNTATTATTNLLASYTSTTLIENSDSSTELNKFNSSYEYDFAGRITHIYYNENDSTNPVLAYYYEYDDAGQLAKEADFLEAIYTEYTYDNYGNVTEKKVYSGEDSFVYRYGTASAASGATPEVINFEYNSYYSDVLERYDGDFISHDEYGNPLTYHGNNQGTPTTYELSWEGNQLQSARPKDDDIIYEYKYDDEGRRTQKFYYSNYTDDNSTEKELVMKTDYVWDDNKLVGYRIFFGDLGTPVTIDAAILYDELDNPIGLKYSMDGLAGDEDNLELADEDIFWFIKDGQGNVKAIFSEKTNYTIGCQYTTSGELSVNVSDSFKEELNKKIEEADDFSSRLLIALSCIFTIQYATMTSIDASQATHHNYIMDVETGLYYCQNRYYSPEYGRFINVDNFERVTDDIENPFNANPFVYYNNDPVNCKGNFSNSKSSSKVVGIQAELSKSLLSFADSVGIEFVYDSVKDEIYAYYYSDANSNVSYITRATKKIQNFLSEISFSSDISLKNLAIIFKINNSASVSYFNTQTDKGFVWPYSYVGTARITPTKTNEYRGYISHGNGYRSHGICYYPTSNLGGVFNELSVKYTKVEIESLALENYLSANKNNIIEAVK